MNFFFKNIKALKSQNFKEVFTILQISSFFEGQKTSLESNLIRYSNSTSVQMVMVITAFIEGDK